MAHKWLIFGYFFIIIIAIITITIDSSKRRTFAKDFKSLFKDIRNITYRGCFKFRHWMTSRNSKQKIPGRFLSLIQNWRAELELT